MYVTVQIIPAFGEDLPYEIYEVAPYDEVELLVNSLIRQLVPEISNRNPVQLHLSVQPEDARVFIDGVLISDISEPLTVFSGQHTISVSATGYQSATKTAVFDGSDNFSISIELEKTELVVLEVDTGSSSASLYIHTEYFGQTPETVTLPSLPTIGQLVSKEVVTYFVFNPDKIKNNDTAEGDEVFMSVKPNKIQTEQRIEKQRNVLYWSLGLLYLSLPPAMLVNGIWNDKYRAYELGRLPQTDDVINNINAWNVASIATIGVSVGLGVNLIIQLTRYLIAADQTVPKVPKAERQ
ncbi:PEGA domain-containing protein [Brucepastera parasyntrophica]|uniref:PEGA domain-containing protein n=1 Tax=Brucepastera parasyntrophica TaxID=2880008 RepID=UPI00210C430C|nr:PEGA domain-containing protein [Brucepastera parasyntrophica]ULQ59932.1 PEGA domain-containing protein [Brucepastera parasyntrophica]